MDTVLTLLFVSQHGHDGNRKVNDSVLILWNNSTCNVAGLYFCFVLFLILHNNAYCFQMFAYF